MSVIAYVSCTTGVNWSIFGYMSNGDMVPEVMTTLLKRSKIGFMAIDGSRQLQGEIVGRKMKVAAPTYVK